MNLTLDEMCLAADALLTKAIALDDKLATYDYKPHPDFRWMNQLERDKVYELVHKLIAAIPPGYCSLTEIDIDPA